MDTENYAGYGFFTSDFDNLDLTNYEKMLLTRITHSKECKSVADRMYVDLFDTPAKVVHVYDTNNYFVFIKNTSPVDDVKHYSENEANSILNKVAKTFLNKVVDAMEDNEIEFANPKQSIDQTQSEMHETIEKLDVSAIAHNDEIENYEG